MVDYEKELQLEDEEPIEETTTPYMIDETLASLKYAFDIDGVYIPFKSSKKPKTINEMEELMSKWDTVDKKRVQLQISRSSAKDCELLYQWVSAKGNKKKDYTYKALGEPVKRTTVLTSEDTSKTGATSLVGKLAKTGEEQGFELDTEDYQTFITNIVKQVRTSNMLDVFKDENYILPSDDTTEDYDIVKEINERVKPTLTEAQKQEALEVEAEIKEKGFVPYMNSILDKTHIGDHRSIIRKILGAYVIISGLDSLMIMTDGHAEVGKSFEDDTVLSFIPERYIFKVNDMTKASFTKKAETHERYFDRLICVFGDLGSQNAFKEVAPVFNIFKILITENEFYRELNDTKDGKKWGNLRQKLSVDSIGVLFQTTKFDFLDMEGDQLASRSIKSTPAKADKLDVLHHMGAKIGIPKSETNQRIYEAKQEMKKFQSYILYTISKGIEVVNPWIEVFIRFVELSKTPFRDFDKEMCLFQAYCTLTHTGCEKVGDNEYLATAEQLETYMNDVNLDNVLPPSESDFLKMLIGKDSKNQLEIIHTGEEGNTEVNDLNIYFNDIIENDLGYSSEDDEKPQKVGEAQSKLMEAVIVETEKPTFDSLRDWEIKEGIGALLEKYRLGGRGKKHENQPNVFFTVSDVKRTHQRRKIYKNIEDVPKLLNKLYNNDFMDKLDYKDVKGQNIYYLTSKCEKLMDSIEVTEEDKAEAKKLLDEEWLGNSETINW